MKQGATQPNCGYVLSCVNYSHPGTGASAQLPEAAKPTDPSALCDQIDRILRSQSFATKGQLRKLLEVHDRQIVAKDLAGLKHGQTQVGKRDPRCGADC